MISYYSSGIQEKYDIFLPEIILKTKITPTPYDT